MSGEKSMRETIEELKEVCAPEQPYTGETRQPTTEMDKLILGTITLFEDDNKPPNDPYVSEGLWRASRKDPSQVTTDEHNKYVFGENFMTRSFDLAEDMRLILAYDTKPSESPTWWHKPQIVIDRFTPGDGLVSRTKFNNSPDDGIVKANITNFNPPSKHDLISIFNENSDFARKLGALEANLLFQLIQNPMDPGALSIARGLTSVNDDEKKLIEKNRAAAEKHEREHRKLIEKNQGGGLIVTDRTPTIGSFALGEPAAIRA